jgi:hypothetical protein
MPKILYGNDKSEADRIRDRLRPSSNETLLGWPPDSVTETVPTRTISSVFYGATQSSTTKQPLRSKPEAVGAGSVFSDNEEEFNKAYGLNQKKGGLRLNDFLLRRKR